VNAIPSIEKVVIVPYVNENPDITGVPRTMLYADFLAQSNKDALVNPESLDYFERLLPVVGR
jgi:hypothetical protein